MPQWVPVHGIQDATSVDASTINKPLFELAERTNYLYARLTSLMGDMSSFEAVRLYSMPLIDTGALAPDVKDVVCLYKEQAAYGKAVASMDLVDEFATAEASYALGVLIDKDGNTGTVLVYGRMSLSTAGTPWAVADLLEPGQQFRNGPYYLSATTPGKLTAAPSGPSVFMGSFVEAGLNPGYGDYALVTPIVRDTGNSHNHRSIKLHSQPAGRQMIAEGDNGYIDGRHYIVGFDPLTPADVGDRVPRLVCLGDWTTEDDVQYTMWLSNAVGTARVTSIAPTGFGDAYLHWTSSDPDEAQGSVRITSFEIPVAVGSHGLKVVMENPTGFDVSEGINWDELFTEVGAADVNKRTWQIDVPLDTEGWLANNVRAYFDNHQAADSGFSLVMMGGPFTGPLSDAVTVRCAQIHALDTTVDVVAGYTVFVGADCFEFTDDGTVTSAANIPVLIDTVSLETTYENLMVAILAQADPDISAARATDTLLIGVAPGLHGVTPGTEVRTVFVGNVNVPIAPDGTGPGVVTAGSGNVSFLVFDRDNNSLVSDGNYFWATAEYWEPVTLSNGIQLMLVPYSANGAAAGSDTVAASDYWGAEVTGPGYGAPFRYSMGMHPGLSLYYPPLPAKAAALVLNGVELDSDMFFDDGTYRCAPDTLYWTTADYERVPWPVDWADRLDTGSPETAHKMLLHFTRNVIGETGYVSSLRAAPNSPIRVTANGTAEPAVTGDLMVSLDLDFSAEDANLAGFNVVKSVQGSRLRRGPVVERLLPGPGVTITQTVGSPSGQGTVIVGLENSAMAYAGDFEEIALENAKQEMIGLFPYIRLLGWTTGGSNRASGFTAKFRVPHTIANELYRVVVYATVFGESNVIAIPDTNVPYAGLQFNYAVLPDVTAVGALGADSSLNLNLVDNLLVPDVPINVAVPMGSNLRQDLFYKAYDPMLIHNYPDEENADLAGMKARVLGMPFPNEDDIPNHGSELGVRPGSLVAVRISRADLIGGGVDEYTYPVGLINLRWMLVRV